MLHRCVQSHLGSLVRQEQSSSERKQFLPFEAGFSHCCLQTGGWVLWVFTLWQKSRQLQRQVNSWLHILMLPWAAGYSFHVMQEEGKTLSKSPKWAFKVMKASWTWTISTKDAWDSDHVRDWSCLTEGCFRFFGGSNDTLEDLLLQLKLNIHPTKRRGMGERGEREVNSCFVS